MLRASGSEVWRARFDRVVRTGPISIRTHPFVGMATYALVIFYTHLRPFMDHMASSARWMLVEQLATGACRVPTSPC